MIKELLRKYLLESTINEAVPMMHFNDRVKEVVGNIQSITLPPSVYLPNKPKETQDYWIIEQIKTKMLDKISAVEAKDYPTSRGSCVLVPLGLIKLQPIKGIPVNVMITAQRKEGIMSGFSYYIALYENRMPTIVLADPKIPANSSIGNQLNAHLKNTELSGWPVDRTKSFIDKSFMDNIIIRMADFTD